MKRIAIGLSVLTVLMLAGPTGAELCEKCKGKMYIMSVGKCVECGGFTGSGAHKLCRKCSAKLGQCEHCRAPLKGAKPQATTKPTTQPAKIDWRKSGTYTSGKWKYKYTVHGLGKTSEERYGRLTYDGKRIADAERDDRIKTPWGMMQHFGSLTRGYGWRFGGWLPKQAYGRPLDLTKGRLLPSPEKAASSGLAAMELDESSNGKTASAVVGQEIIIRLKGNATTGYSWVVGKIEGDALGQVGKVKYVSDQPPMPAGGGDRRLMRHKVGGGGKYVFTFRATKAGTAKLTLEYKRLWEKGKPPAKTFTLTVNVKADCTAERVKRLKANLDKFTLDLIYFGAGLSQAQNSVYDLTLTTTDFVRGYPSSRLMARISKDQALRIIDHLAKGGFLSKAREIDGKISLSAPREQTYRFFAGPTSPGGKFFFADIGWDMKMLTRLDGLRKVLDGDAAKAMDKLLKRLEPQRKKWQKPAAKPVGKADRPHPEIWRKYPNLKKKLDADLGRMKTYLKSLEPGAFAARHPELVKMAKSDDPQQRVRAIKAISALRDKSSLSVVVAAIEKEKTPHRNPRGYLICRVECLSCLTTWVYDAYHPDRKVPRELAPLLPLFVKMLVETGDKRSYCFQAIGCLAGPEWLPLLKDLSASRHPAVTHWSAWALKEITKRAQPAAKSAKKPLP